MCKVRNILPVFLLITMLVSCSSSNSTQVFAAMSGLNAGATLGGALGGLTSRSPRGYHLGTTIGALSGAAIGAIATAPRTKDDGASSAPVTLQKSKGNVELSALSGMRRDIRVTNVLFVDSSGDGVLSPGETATVSYDIINVSPDEVKLLVPRVQLKRQAKHIYISPMQNITNVLPAEGVRYSVTLTADARLKNSNNEVMLSLSADNGATFEKMSSIYFRTEK